MLTVKSFFTGIKSGPTTGTSTRGRMCRRMSSQKSSFTPHALAPDAAGSRQCRYGSAHRILKTSELFGL
jgi:hypothetical protein